MREDAKRREGTGANRAIPMTVKRYKTIYADPPWAERGAGQVVRGAQRHYPLMNTEDIMALKFDGIPICQYAEDNAHLYLWTTNNFLPHGLQVIKAWGFDYKTCITWAKDKIGLGQYYRGQTEHCLFAVRGVLPYRFLEGPEGLKRAQGATLITAPRGEHSVKPDRMRAMIETVSHGPFLELFARHKMPGWDTIGNEELRVGLFSEDTGAPTVIT
jgi:N6-adenosine-specific RNA methylase IME4